MYRLKQLIRLGRRVYHTTDLALLWGIASPNTLYTAIKRYVQKGILIPVFKGLYATVPLTDLNPIELGRSLFSGTSYLTMESVLFQAGIINQPAMAWTFVGETSRSLQISGQSFRCRRLQDKYLFNPVGIINNNGVLEASLERAVADMLYYNRKFYFDNQEGIDWLKVKLIQKTLGYVSN